MGKLLILEPKCHCHGQEITTVRKLLVQIQLQNILIAPVSKKIDPYPVSQHPRSLCKTTGSSAAKRKERKGEERGGGRREREGRERKEKHLNYDTSKNSRNSENETSTSLMASKSHVSTLDCI